MQGAVIANKIGLQQVSIFTDDVTDPWHILEYLNRLRDALQHANFKLTPSSQPSRNLFDLPRDHQPARLHNRDVRTHLRQLQQDMRTDNNRLAHCLQSPQQFAQLHAGAGIESRGRFISSSTSGSCTRARARHSRCFIPRDSDSTSASPFVVRSTSSSRSLTVLACFLRAIPWIPAKNSRYSTEVKSG